MQRQFSLDVDCMSSKERWAWPRHSTPTDRPAVERDSRDTGNKVFLLVGPISYCVLISYLDLCACVLARVLQRYYMTVSAMKLHVRFCACEVVHQ